MKNRRYRPFTSSELHRLNRDHPNGLTTAEVIGILATHRFHLSEPTFRKYIQLGLLPRSSRVGTTGRNRGSYGRYPVAIIPLIVQIRHLSGTTSLTLEDIRVRLAFGLRMSEVQRADAELFRLLEQALRTVDAALSDTHKHHAAITRLRQGMDELRKRMRVLHSELTSASQPLERRLPRAA